MASITLCFGLVSYQKLFFFRAELFVTGRTLLPVDSPLRSSSLLTSRLLGPLSLRYISSPSPNPPHSESRIFRGGFSLPPPPPIEHSSSELCSGVDGRHLESAHHRCHSTASGHLADSTYSVTMGRYPGGEFFMRYCVIGSQFDLGLT